MKPAPDKAGLLLAAAHSASDASAELLRRLREDDPEGTSAYLFDDAEPLEKLLDAAKMLIEAEDKSDENRNQLHGAIGRFLEGWAP